MSLYLEVILNMENFTLKQLSAKCKRRGSLTKWICWTSQVVGQRHLLTLLSGSNIWIQIFCQKYLLSNSWHFGHWFLSESFPITITERRDWFVQCSNKYSDVSNIQLIKYNKYSNIMIKYNKYSNIQILKLIEPLEYQDE